MDNKPSIVIITEKPDNPALKEILAGIEEEGVPFQIELESNGDARNKALQGAEKSSLETGIGIGRNEVYVALRNAVLYKASSNAYPEELRKLGANAARYVKGIPFKI